MRISLLVFAFVLCGCSQLPISNKLGHYSVNVTDEGAEVIANTVKGGPDIKWKRDADGNTELTVTPSQQLVIDALLKLAP